MELISDRWWITWACLCLRARCCLHNTCMSWLDLWLLNILFSHIVKLQKGLISSSEALSRINFVLSPCQSLLIPVSFYWAATRSCCHIMRVKNAPWNSLVLSLKCEYLLVFLVCSDGRFSIFGFWIIGRIKPAVCRHHCDIFHYSLTYFRPNDS